MVRLHLEEAGPGMNGLVTWLDSGTRVGALVGRRIWTFSPVFKRMRAVYIYYAIVSIVRASISESEVGMYLKLGRNRA